MQRGTTAWRLCPALRRRTTAASASSTVCALKTDCSGTIPPLRHCRKHHCTGRTPASAAIVYARAGRPAVARRYLDSLLALGRKTSLDPYNVGQAYAFLGETDRALAYFSRAIDERSVQAWFLGAEWLPEGFKADPRFHALLRRIGLE